MDLSEIFSKLQEILVHSVISAASERSVEEVLDRLLPKSSFSALETTPEVRLVRDSYQSNEITLLLKNHTSQHVIGLFTIGDEVFAEITLGPYKEVRFPIKITMDHTDAVKAMGLFRRDDGDLSYKPLVWIYEYPEKSLLKVVSVELPKSELISLKVNNCVSHDQAVLKAIGKGLKENALKEIDKRVNAIFFSGDLDKNKSLATEIRSLCDLDVGIWKISRKKDYTSVSLESVALQRINDIDWFIQLPAKHIFYSSTDAATFSSIFSRFNQLAKTLYAQTWDFDDYSNLIDYAQSFRRVSLHKGGFRGETSYLAPGEDEDQELDGWIFTLGVIDYVLYGIAFEDQNISGAFITS